MESDQQQYLFFQNWKKKKKSKSSQIAEIKNQDPWMGFPNTLVKDLKNIFSKLPEMSSKFE